jgi:hypothetical protein
MSASKLMMERVDSGTTDDSPFASSLTTPVDEDVHLQLYQNRKFGNSNVEIKEIDGGHGGSRSAIYVGSPEEGPGREVVVCEKELFRQELEKKVCDFSREVPSPWRYRRPQRRLFVYVS